jgi:hypothetical protein
LIAGGQTARTRLSHQQSLEQAAASCGAINRRVNNPMEGCAGPRELPTESTTKAEMIMDLTRQLFRSSREMIKALGIPTDLAC